MTTSTKVKSFVKEFVAKVKGEDAEALGQKVLRHADSALKRQISSLDGDTITLEDNLEVAKENQKLALINNGQNLTDRDLYVRNLLKAKNNVTDAEEALKLHEETIAFLKSQLAALDEEVDA